MKNIVIEAGSIIRIGDRRSLSKKAIGLEYQLSRKINYDPKHLKTTHGKVVHNPNGWESDEVYHDLNLDYDKIIRFIGEGLPNKDLKYALDKVDN